MDHDKIIFKRFIENELRQPDFLNCADYEQLTEETFLLCYVAGHGSADTHQKFVLNESDEDKAFWDIEKELIKLARLCGHPLKIIAVYDVCREPVQTTLESMRRGKKAKALLSSKQAI